MLWPRSSRSTAPLYKRGGRWDNRSSQFRLHLVVDGTNAASVLSGGGPTGWSGSMASGGRPCQAATPEDFLSQYPSFAAQNCRGKGWSAGGRTDAKQWATRLPLFYTLRFALYG